MTLEQLTICGLLLVLLVVFAFDRFRVELVAIAGLAAGIALGLVPSAAAFAGLASPAVITVVEILLIIHALQRSRILDHLAGWLLSRFKSPRRISMALCFVGACLSTVMNNIGAFALMLPVAHSVTRRTGASPRAIFMPLSFATLLGGLCTSIGTPANLIVSDMLARESGRAIGFLSFAPVGLIVGSAGLLLIGLWTIPRLDVAAGEAEEDELRERRMVCELRVRPGAPAGYSAGDAAAALGGEVRNVIRAGRNIFPLDRSTPLRPEDILLVEADRKALDAALADGALAAGGGKGERIEAAVMPRSTLAGSRIAAVAALDGQNVAIIGVATQNPRVEGRLSDLQLAIGDVLHLEGEAAALRRALADTGLVELAPLAPIEKRETMILPVTVFALGIAAAATNLAQPSIAFGAVVAVLALTGTLDLRAALSGLNWPIVILLAAMLPLGDAIASTGAAAAIASGLAGAFPVTTPLAVTMLIFVAAIIITPFVNNATAAIVLGPVAIELAHSTGVPATLLLMAVAVGVSTDFLTPFGHHNNTLAYGLGDYRFRDFFRAGWPLTVSALVIGAAACFAVWGG